MSYLLFFYNHTCKSDDVERFDLFLLPLMAKTAPTPADRKIFFAADDEKYVNVFVSDRATQKVELFFLFLFFKKKSVIPCSTTWGHHNP